MDNLVAIERELNEARDALFEFWEQAEGQACYLALRTADDAITDYRAAMTSPSATLPPQVQQRIERLASEVIRLRAALEGAM